MLLVQVIGALVGILELGNILIRELVRFCEDDDFGVILLRFTVPHDRHCKDWLHQFPQSLPHRLAHLWEFYSDMIVQPIIVLLKLSVRGARLKTTSSRSLVGAQKESYFLCEQLAFDLPPLPESLLFDMVDCQ